MLFFTFSPLVNRPLRLGISLAIPLLAVAAVCGPMRSAPQIQEATVVAKSADLPWNGVTVSSAGRLFASLPRESNSKFTPSVAEIMPDGKLRAYPGGHWNNYKLGELGNDKFIGINSVVSDAQDQLWVVDSAGVGGKPIKGKAKLVQIDLKTNTVMRVYPLGLSVIPEGGFINDVRVSEGFAFCPIQALAP